MKNLKALKEKRSKLVDELEVMVSGLETEGEVRSLTVEEREMFDAKKVEIENIDATISRIEESRAKSISEDAVKELQEERSKDVAEKRALENFFRGMDLASEERAILASTSTNQALMPLEISKSIMKRLEEQCAILDKAKKFNSKGTLRLLKEDTYGAAGLTEENAAFKDSDVAFKHVELRAFKVTAMVQATFEMLQNVDIDLTQYLMDVIVRRLSKELNKLFLLGTGVNQPEGILKKGIEVEIDEIGIDTFITMQTAVHPDYLNGAAWLMGREVFGKVANLLDGNGRPYLVSHVINDKIAYKFLGIDVIVDNNMDNVEEGKCPVALVNIGEAYAINILTDITVRHLTEVGFTQGYEVFAGYVMADGRIVNEDAIVRTKVKAAMAASARAKK